MPLLSPTKPLICRIAHDDGYAWIADHQHPVSLHSLFPLLEWTAHENAYLRTGHDTQCHCKTRNSFLVSCHTTNIFNAQHLCHLQLNQTCHLIGLPYALEIYHV